MGASAYLVLLLTWLGLYLIGASPSSIALVAALSVVLAMLSWIHVRYHQAWTIVLPVGALVLSGAAVSSQTGLSWIALLAFASLLLAMWIGKSLATLKRTS